MKTLASGEFLKSKLFLKITGFTLITFAFFYLGKNWSDGYQQLTFFNTNNNLQSPSSTQSSPSISISPNAKKEFDVAALINQTDTHPDAPIDTQSINSTSPEDANSQQLPDPVPPVPSPIPPTPPPPPSITRFGIVDENGTMTEDFEVGEFDPEFVENWGNNNETVSEEGEEHNGEKPRI